MDTIKINKIVEYMSPVSYDEDGNPSEEKAPRVLVSFVRETKALGGLKSQKQFGSMPLDRDITLEKAEAELDLEKDYSSEVSFTTPNEDGFFRAVLS